MAKARQSVKGRGGQAPVLSTSAQAVTGKANTIPPVVLAQDPIEDDDLCDCGHSSIRHPGQGNCRYASACGCVGLCPR